MECDERNSSAPLLTPPSIQARQTHLSRHFIGHRLVMLLVIMDGLLNHGPLGLDVGTRSLRAPAISFCALAKQFTNFKSTLYRRVSILINVMGMHICSPHNPLSS